MSVESDQRPEVTLAYYRGTVPKYEKHKRFSYIETVPKAATLRWLLKCP